MEDWDSLTHVNLVTAIEKRYKVKFALGELQDLKDVGDLANLAGEETGFEVRILLFTFSMSQMCRCCAGLTTKRNAFHLHHAGYAAEIVEPLAEQGVLRSEHEVCTDVILPADGGWLR